jgi:hypothetical protein
MFFVLSRRGRFTRWLYGYPGGLAEVGDAIPRFPSIADLITDRAVTPVVARQAAAVRDGAVITRDEVRVTRDGIAGPKDAALTPWAAIERVELRAGRVKVRLGAAVNGPKAMPTGAAFRPPHPQAAATAIRSASSSGRPGEK